jgi:hypothetical protein
MDQRGELDLTEIEDKINAPDKVVKVGNLTEWKNLIIRFSETSRNKQAYEISKAGNIKQAMSEAASKKFLLANAEGTLKNVKGRSRLFGYIIEGAKEDIF